MPRHLTIEDMIVEIGDGKIFSVEFIKKTNGEYRKMVARRGVYKGVKNDEGTNGAWNRKALDAMHKVLTVYDVNKLEDKESTVLLDIDGNVVNKKDRGAFRRINLDGLKKAKINGVSYIFDEDKKVLVEVDELETSAK